MAKSKKRSRASAVPPVNAIDLRSMLRPVRFVTRPHTPPLADLLFPSNPENDRRRFKPDRSISPPSSSRAASRVTAYPRGPMQALGFADPRRVIICARRKIRREVLHAKRIAGGRGMKRRRLNFWSNISCK